MDQSRPEGDLYRYFLDRSRPRRRIHKWHHYFDIYERFFAPWRGRAPTLIEIGVYNGGSLQMWQAYFGPEAHIVGIDVNPACARFAEGNTRIFIGDQADRAFLRAVLADIGQPHIVIDDGGHSMNQQITSFEELYPAVAIPGVYLVEDTHTSFFGRRWVDRDDGLTFLDFAFDRCRELHDWTRSPAEFRRLGTPPDQRGPAREASAFCRTTGAISFFDSVVVFERKARPEPWHESR